MCKKNKHRCEEEKQNIIKRLNVIEGQIRGIKQMVEDDRYCSDIIIQLSASMHSLKSLGNNMLKNHMKTCMVDNVKNDKYYLDKIVADLKFIIDHTKGKKQAEIEENDLLIDSIMFRIIQIAENNNCLSDEFKNAHREIPWMAIKGMRNKIVHNYGVVSMSIVYDTVMHGIPEMYEQLTNII